MVKCSFCGREAIYCSRLSGKCYCETHFSEYVEKKVRRAVKRYRMIRKGDRVLVTVSGGKDSLTALYILKKLTELYPFEVEALMVDEGIHGYRDPGFVGKWAAEWDVPLHVVTYREFFGFDMEDVVRRIRERGLNITPCHVDGVLRRYLINRWARENGFDRVATGHNLDDTVQTVLINLFKNSVERLARGGPVTGVEEHPKLVPRIKPLYFVREREVAIYAYIHGYLKEKNVMCPYVVLSMRHEVRKMLNRFEERFPGTKESILNSYLEMLPLLSSAYRGELRECRICGEPTSGEVCRACQLREALGFYDK